MTKEVMDPLMVKKPYRTMDEYVEPIHTYEEEHTNAAGETYTVTVKVYPDEPTPTEFLLPAFAWGGN